MIEAAKSRILFILFDEFFDLVIFLSKWNINHMISRSFFRYLIKNRFAIKVGISM